MCDTLVVVGDDGVLFAKNSDRDANEAQLLHWQPAADHPPGATVTCTWRVIPQVAHTHAVLLSRPFWMWGAEMGTNEHGVTIGNEAVFTHAKVPRSGLTGMDLLRLALERASTAQQAVAIIVELIEAFGQGGGCGHEHRDFRYFSSYIVADPRGAFVLETTAGAHAIEAVSGARSISNGLTIPGFAERHSSWLETRVSACRTRRARTEAAAGSARDLGALMAALRDHGDGPWPRYRWLNGAMAAPCMHAGGVATASRTTASWVAWLRPDRHTHFATATGAPCLSLFKPVDVHTPLDLGPSPGDRADDSLWWRQERLNRLVLRDPERLAGRFVGERDELEARWLAAAPPSAEAFSIGSAKLDRWLARVQAEPVEDRRPAFVRRYWRARDRKAGL